MANSLNIQVQNTASLKAHNQPLIWILGGPGSGKGTLCERLVKHYGFTHISSGDLLRADVQSGSERGKQLKNFMEKGELVPLNVVLGLIAEKMMSVIDSSKGFLIDGYPREVDQGMRFEEDIKPCDLIIYLEANDDVMVARLLNRGLTSGRADDNEETIKNRLKTFHKFNDPIVKVYESKMLKINAQLTPEETFEKASEAINKLLK